jgi:small GTP-binding protein
MTEPDEDCKYLVKLIVIGSSGVGKSSLLLRYALDTFKEDTRTTIGVDFKHKKLKIDGELVNCQIWDTAGQERFSCISKEYYRGANGCLLVYDITDESTFTRVDHWYQELLTYAHTAETPVTVIVGNKCDLKQQAKVKTEDATLYAKNHNMHFFETSAKLNYNVEEAFRVLVEDIVHKMKKASTNLGGKSTLTKPDTVKVEPDVPLDENETIIDKKKEDKCC